MNPVDVIIPVFEGYEEVSACLNSVLAARQRTPVDYVVINDASPDPRIRRLLENLAASGRILLLTNSVNRGFVETVNRGMARSLDRDVVLLNSDTVVSADWLDRLAAAAQQSTDVATVTPFSNNAEICSFPRLCRDSPLPLPPGDIDSMLREHLAGQRLTLPTAVGFCMYIRRACLSEIGDFDARAFGRGYGEENDFCLRARAAGWRHVLAADCFVQHVGGVSFSAEKRDLVERAMAVLDRRYPAYHAEIARFMEADPAYALRCKGLLECLRVDRRLKVLAVTHHLGGGTEKHVRELADSADAQARVLVLKPFRNGVLRLTLGVEEDYPGLNFDWSDGGGREALFELLRHIGIGRVHIHHLLEMDAVIDELLRRLALPYDITLHDYYMIDGNPTLTDGDGLFRAERSQRGSGCNSARRFDDDTQLGEWQARHQRLFDGAARIFAPSAAALAIYRDSYRLPTAIVSGHADMVGVESAPVSTPALSSERPLRVLVLGALGLEKGADLLEAAAIEARRAARPLEFVLLGYAYRPLDRSVNTLGAYDDARIDELIAGQSAHVIWFPCRWPETYSYTLSAALRAGLPLLVPDIGSFPERVQGRPLTWIAAHDSGAGDYLAQLMRIRAQLLAAGPETLNWSPPPLGAFRYDADYGVTPPAGAGETGFTLEQVMRHLAGPADRREDGLRLRVLRLLARLKQHPALAWLARRIPYKWQRFIKRRLTRRPLHEVAP